MKYSNPPDAAALMTTARSFGSYDLAAALADLIDNSITADASDVAILFEPGESDVTVRIRDNGVGMTREILIAAMRPASTNPDSARDPADLGRFGWGLKSASLSQARVLTVVTWRHGAINAARWDIDDIDGWAMEVMSGEEASGLLRRPPETIGGTEVIWTKTDRLVADQDNRVDDGLTQSIAQANQRLSLTFHRFLAGEGETRLTVSVNGSRLKPRDPFLASHNATQTLDAEAIQVRDGQRISVKPYILPHYSKLTTEEQRELGGPEGMVRNQGFYVYRNRRLIIHGTWFRLMPHSELSQLTRVRVDLPNALDAEWRITVDKSGAQLPPALRKRLREVVSKFSRRSSSAHRQKGVTIDSSNRTPVWKRVARHGRISYLINRDHPLVERLLGSSKAPEEAEIVLSMIEQYLPSEHLVADAGSNECHLAQGATDPSELDRLLSQCAVNYLHATNGTPDLTGFLAFIRNIEPFASQWTYTESRVRDHYAMWFGGDNGI
ncbi:ATP-binding protein [Spiribacter sp. 1M153]|uniref:ATP-binding protein n=1 Tax=Spiribacter roseus TaxID=1855875 RepID=UPI00349F17D5